MTDKEHDCAQGRNIDVSIIHDDEDALWVLTDGDNDDVCAITFCPFCGIRLK